MKLFKNLKPGSIFSLSYEGDPLIKFSNYAASNLRYSLEIKQDQVVYLIKKG